MKTTAHDHALALRYIRGEISEEELRAGMRPSEGDIILALQAELGRLRREHDEMAADLRAANEYISRMEVKK